MTAIEESSRSDGALERQQALKEGMSSFHSRALNITSEGLLLTCGALCLPIGIIVIILGWVGAAHTSHVFEQNDYLISGGLLGLGLVFVGGFLYFGYWMTRQLRATEAGTQQTLRALARLEDQRASEAISSSNLSPAAAVLVVTEHGHMLHRTTCPAVADRSVRIVQGEDEIAGYQPCTVCDPFG
jgi:hypothetical protein